MAASEQSARDRDRDRATDAETETETIESESTTPEGLPKGYWRTASHKMNNTRSPYRGGMQVHAVPEAERAFDANGQRLPWAYEYAE